MADEKEVGMENVESLQNEAPDGIKVIILGDSAVGKSKLVERYLMDDYVPQQLSTFALTTFAHTATVKNKEDEDEDVDFVMWDTAGQEKFKTMHNGYYYNAACCILVFDVQRKTTYKNLKQWYDELRRAPGCKHIPVFVVANKIDVDPSVVKKSFAFAKNNDLPLLFASACDGTNVVDLFTQAFQAAKSYNDNPKKDFMAEVLDTLNYFEKKDKAEGKLPGATA